MESWDLKDFDDLINFPDNLHDTEFREKILRYKERIVRAKSNTSFWDKDMPELISLLETSKEKIKMYEKDQSEIGGKDLPNQDIISLIKKGILTTETIVSKIYKGEEYEGRLTKDGYLELNVKGIKKKLTLRKAALYAWGSNPPNQWMFWEAIDSNGEKKPLEHFRKLLA